MNHFSLFGRFLFQLLLGFDQFYLLIDFTLRSHFLYWHFLFLDHRFIGESSNMHCSIRVRLHFLGPTWTHSGEVSTPETLRTTSLEKSLWDCCILPIIDNN
mmetsp:Transcript_45509/g.93089  ORF Transcript_45509/g.93089 Transcript_45509/m.93089 type:complete len:101 (-) Transcript_45509:81-383(-)